MMYDVLDAWVSGRRAIQFFFRIQFTYFTYFTYFYILFTYFLHTFTYFYIP
jgi:hypothetical protein